MDGVGKNRVRLLIILIIALYSTLELLKITIQNELDPMSTEYAQVESQIYAISQSNVIMYQTLLTEESLTIIATEAAQMGFIPTTDYIYLH